jgi:serine/threonine protein kinase/Tol biopolymer transport system component
VTLASGTKLGPYEIVSPLGAGGMGEVYRGRDTRLGREVAIKVLPQHLSSNPEVRARFEREAKAVSSLNHPHVCVLHDVGREGETDYLVMELIEGETLAARLTKGPLPGPDALKLGAQIADALDRAHRAGVMHRDLKPGNVMLTKSGAKLMDFGLARATGLSGPDSGNGAAMTASPTLAQPLTAEGTIVGTFQYMSPEQLEGRETDARSDIWALGCVLYEMATGTRAFDGTSQASLIGSIMHKDPAPMAQLAPMSPHALERLVRQCLAKDPTERWQSAGDVRRELEWIASSTSQAGGSLAVPSRRRGLPRGAAGLLAGFGIAAIALVYAFGPWHVTKSEAPLVRFELNAPEGTTLKNTAEPALSPDGTSIVFGVTDAAGVDRLCIRALASPDARVVAGTEGAALPFWSPDGRLLAYFANGKLLKVALDGSAPMALCDAPDARGGAWSPDGTIVFAPNSQGPIVRVPATGGKPVEVTKLDKTRGERGHRYPQFLPDGRHFLYVAVGTDEEVVTYAGSLDGGDATKVCQAGSAGRFAPPGFLLYLDRGVNFDKRRLLAQRFDPATLRTAGDAELLIDPASANNYGYANVTADDRGTLVIQHTAVRRVRLSWMDRSGRVTGVAADGLQMLSGALSPDGKRLAYAGLDPRDLFVLDLASGVATRISFENKLVNSVVWSPDGRTIAFARSTEAGWKVYTRAADGTGAESLLFPGTGMFNYPESWSKDGRWLVARSADEGGGFDLWKIPIGGGAAELYQRTPARETGASLSPDGRWVVYSADDDGKTELYVQSFPTAGSKYQVSFPDPAGATWSSDDEILVGNSRREFFSVQVSTAGGFRQGSTNRLFAIPTPDFPVDVSSDQKSFLIGSVTNRQTLSHLEVVLGWPRLIEKGK